MVVHGWDHSEVDGDGLDPNHHASHQPPTHSDGEAPEVPDLLLVRIREPDDHLLLLWLIALKEGPEEVQPPWVLVHPDRCLVGVVLPQREQVHRTVITEGGSLVNIMRNNFFCIYVFVQIFGFY